MHESESQKLKLLMVGMSAYIYLLNPITVLKVPRIDEDDGITEANREATRTEASAYKLLGHHPRLANCTYISASKEHLELEYYPNGTLRKYVDDHRKGITDGCLRRWARQIIESVAYIHDMGVRHSDLRLDQWLLDSDLNARLSDFNGSGYDARPSLDLEGSKAIGLEKSSHFLPRSPTPDNTVESDLFALGSVLYELVVGENPYQDLDDGTIEALYSQGKFPSVEGLFLEEIIIGCWIIQFHSAHELLRIGVTQYGM